MKHLICGGEVNTTAMVPYCKKCGKSKASVEKDNVRATTTAPAPRAKPPKPPPKVEVQKGPWWNTKLFKSEREALLYRSDKADELALEANELFRKVGQEKFNEKSYTAVRKLYQRAAEVAEREGDGVSHALYSSMDPMIDRHMALHKERGYPDAVAPHEDEGQEAQRPRTLPPTRSH